MKKFYIFAISLVIVGLLAGLLFYPTRTEYGLMLAESGFTESAMREFQGYISSTNDISRKAIIPLSHLYFDSGNTQKAIDLLKRRIEINPSGVEGELQLISQYYHDSYDPEDYINTLQVLAKVSDSYTTYKRLAFLYQEAGYPDKYVEALKSLIKTKDYKFDFQDYYTLIYYYVSDRDYDDAFVLINSLLKRENNIASIPSYYITFIIDVLIQIDKKDLAISILRKYINNSLTSQDTKTMIISSIAQNYPDEARKLLLYLLRKNPGNPRVLKSLFELKDNDAELYSGEYKTLLNEFESNTLPPELYGIFLLKIIYSENSYLLKTFLAKASSGIFTLNQLTEAAQYIYLNNNKQNAELLCQKLGSDLLGYMPVVKILLEGCIENIPPNKIVEHILNQNDYLNQTDLGYFVFLLSSNNYADLAFKLIENLSLRKAIRISGPDAFAYIIFSTGRSKDCIERLTSEISKPNISGKSSMEETLFLLTSINGDTYKSNEMLNKISDDDKKVRWLTALYDFSIKLNNNQVSLFASTTLFDILKNDKTELMLVNSYILNEDFKEALRFFSAARLQSKDFVLMYISLFTKLYENKEEALMKENSKDFDSLCTILKDKWKGYSLSDKASIVYLFVISNKKDDAINMFYSIADELPYDSPVLQDLLNIPEFSKQSRMVNFMIDKAEQSPNIKEKKAWLAYLSQTGHVSSAIKILESTLKDTDIYSTAFNSLYPSLIYHQAPSSKLNNTVFNNYANTYLSLLYKSGDYGKFDEILHKVLIENIDNFNDDQKIAICSLLLKINHNKNAYKFFSAVPIDKALSDMTSGQFAEVYWKNNCPDQGITVITTLLTKKTSSHIKDKLAEAQAMLYAAKGDTVKLEGFLRSGPIRDIRGLSNDIYRVSEATKHPESLLVYAGELYKNYPTSQNYEFYIYALLVNKNYEEVLSLIKNPLDSTYNTQTFLEALNGINSKSKKTTVSKYDTTIKLLYDKLYNAENQDTSDLRNLGYLLADSGNNDLARNIFYNLSLNAPPESDDVKELVFLMGENCTWEKGVELLNKRALSSKGQEQVQWLKYLNQTGSWDQVIKIIEQKQ